MHANYGDATPKIPSDILYNVTFTSDEKISFQSEIEKNVILKAYDRKKRFGP